jgi:hypothetical protein
VTDAMGRGCLLVSEKLHLFTSSRDVCVGSENRTSPSVPSVDFKTESRSARAICSSHSILDPIVRSYPSVAVVVVVCLLVHAVVYVIDWD